MSTTDNVTAIDITPNQDGGVMKTVLREGTGDERPFAGDNVSVHYVGTLEDGTQFDSSRDRGEKFEFQVGKGSVIKGWDLGVPTMRRGELARFAIKSEYGYGESGSPPTIPGGATLIFEIELFDFHGEDISDKRDKSVVKRTIKAGSGYQTPNEGARCVVRLKGMDSNGRVFDERDNVEFEIGEGSRANVVEGIEHGLTRFHKDETSRLYLKPSMAFGSKGNEQFGVAGHADVVYEVELKSFEKAKESWQLNGQEKIEQSELLKNKGTELFKESKFDLAAKKYAKIVDFLANEVYETDKDKESSRSLQLAANLNLAACYLKTKEYRRAIESCEKALKIDEKNEKGLFRMGQAHYGEGEYEEAIKWFARVHETNADNKEATNLISLSRQKIKESHEKEKALYAKMFSALSK